MIETVTELSRLRAVVNGWKREGLRVALVPTMGNLHAGHYSLVTLARQYADRVVSSVFVNPTQFGPNEDFTRYPRTPEADTSGLEQAGCDVLWLPTVESMYPFGVELAANVHVPGISSLLEGAHRPGHFDGVCTVVSRLFNQVQPDVAAFGKKDYQQLAVIRQLVEDLAFPIQIVGGDIVREEDGLAMSSRNQYLNGEQRPVSTTIHQVLLGMREGFIAGKARSLIEAEATAALQAAGFQVDYAVIRLPDLSEPADSDVGNRVALIAARIGSTRLIDNLEF
ncbi:pantoate--beta-alanine ligase [Stenotrophomonas sp. 278]|uniref:pantoate--beta-alanine ligase n=1 Tax=Stenotrophomonas sp. 278 TaxID=2479851 RepID=UPI000F68AA0E|nr:pantoate--beta-alanine ligase [Stenotrophomonas sp. 278]RRU07853.1 pantoate--beta-alanine ligase [Stenotrophomonas sp. 278]